ncbi:MAG: histidine phosphatase family protein [Candidatus Eisenbacteria bacterium]
MAAVDQRFFLIRHGETEFNRLGIFRGRYEVDLNDRGRRQAGEIGAALANEGIDFILTSPLSRAVETAEIVSRSIGVEYKVDEAFNNISLGEWQGVEKKTIQHDYPDQWKLWTSKPENLVIPGGETVEQVRQRSFSRLVDITLNRRSTFAVVTHRSVIKTLAASLLEVPPPYFWKFYIDNAAYSVFGYDEAGFTLLNWNKNDHLSESVTEVF